MSTMRTIEKNAILVELSISQWTGRRYDRASSNEFNASKKAAPDASRIHKAVVDPAMLKPTSRQAYAIRRYMECNTLPWSDTGQRILPVLRLQEFRDGFETLKTEFLDEVDRFIHAYRADVRQEAARLGDLFDLSDYPSPAVVREKFDAKLKFLPIPAGDDFRVDFDADTIEMLRSELESELATKQASILTGLWRDVGVHLTTIAERLKDPDARFRRELTDNARDLLLRIEDLNVFDDPDLAALAAESKRLCDLIKDPIQLREDGIARDMAACEAQRIVAEFDDLW